VQTVGRALDSQAGLEDAAPADEPVRPTAAARRAWRREIADAPPPRGGFPGREEVLCRRLLRLASEAPAGAAVELWDRRAVVGAPSAGPAGADDLRRLAGELIGAAAVSELRLRVVAEGDEPGPFHYVADPQAGFDGLTRGMLDAGGEEDSWVLLLLSARDDSERLRRQAARFLTRVLDEGMDLAPGRWSAAAAESLYRQWSDLSDGSTVVGDALDRIRLQGVFRDVATARELGRGRSFDAAAMAACVEPALALTGALPGFDPDRPSARRFLGRLESLRDREAAAGLLADAGPDEPEAATYLPTSAIEHGRAPLEARREALFADLEVLNPASPGTSGPVWLFSCDMAALSAWFPYWLSVAETCKARGVELHFVLCADAEDVDRSLDAAEELRRALAAFRRLDLNRYADNVGFSTWRTPDWCADPVAFQDVSRFLAAGELTRRLGRPMLVQDIAAVLVRDPAAYAAQLADARLAARTSQGLQGLAPWRRVLPDQLHVPDDEASRAAVADLELYLLAGLAQAETRGLAANALAWLSERLPGGLALLPPRSPTERPAASACMDHTSGA